MIRFQNSFQQSSGRCRRRDVLQWGGLAGLSWMLPRSAAAENDSASLLPGFGRAKSVIVVLASGGQSQIDMWDPKSDAPVEIRGEFESIPTAVPGVHFCEHMPQIARIADRLCVVRNMSHEDLDHGSAFYLAMTGRYHRRRSANPLPAPEDVPCMGAVLHRVRPATEFAQTSIHINGPAEVPNIVAPGQFGGLLGKAFDPLTIGDVTQQDFTLPSLLPHDDVPTVRMDARRSLLKSIEDSMTELESAPKAIDKSHLYSSAFDMLSRTDIRSAFDLTEEPDSLRDRYGRNRSGQACLLARRLAQAGMPLITVIWNHNNRGQDKDITDTDLYGWDTHNDIFGSLKDHLLPRFDQGFSALIEDLEQQGMMDDTLVVCMGEFGRAPLVALEPRFAGASAGRKHWSWVYSIVMAGAGVVPGSVVGSSDERGAYPAVDPYGPWDVTATIFSALGIDPHLHYKDPLNRPFRISDGEVMQAVYGS